MSGLDAGAAQFATWSTGSILIAVGTIVLVMGGVIAAATHRLQPFVWGLIGMALASGAAGMMSVIHGWFFA